MTNPYLNLLGFSRLPLIRQATASECGLACLAMVAGYHGHSVDLNELRRQYPVSLNGATLGSIANIAQGLELGSRAVRGEIGDLDSLRLPCILHWKFNHFVVLSRVTKRHVEIYDPAEGVRRVHWENVDKAFTGVALELSPTERFARKPRERKLKLLDLIRTDRQFFSSFSLGLLLSLLSEALLLSAPFYMQLTIDEVLMKGDRALLNTLAIAFAFIIFIQVLSNVIRQLTFQYLGQVISFDMSARVFQTMMRLPVTYFTTREMGDVQHRVQSLSRIQRFITTGAPALVMDSIFAALILIVLLTYSIALAMITLGAISGYVVWRVLIYRAMRRAAGDQIVAEANVQTDLLESLRAISSLKLNNLTTLRESRWRNALARRINANIRLGNLSISNKSMNEFLFQGVRVLLIFVGASMVLAGDFSIGMLTAFMAYNSMITTRASALVDQFVQLKLLSVPLQRVSDIVLSRPENIRRNGRDAELNGAIALNEVSFRYGVSESLVLEDASLEVAPGEFIAIVGPSGVGKSTALKLLAGIYNVNKGEVLFDGHPLKKWNLNAIRSQVGLILQEDHLLRGSVAENIALFDENIDLNRVRKLAEACGVAQEIEQMPMGYETLVGDMGSSLSGGQKQRVLLARALYRNPKILLLDEATSQLDNLNEQLIKETLNDLSITRVVVAHRKTTIESADKVYRVRNRNFELVRSERVVRIDAEQR